MADDLSNAVYLDVEAEPRYWEDATVNGVGDKFGQLIPGRSGHVWQVRIDLAEGHIVGWPAGTEASIHYKVCDAGEYWLCDASGARIAKYRSDYVPDDFLCHGSDGFGDYIILKVAADGTIADYRRPRVEPVRWIRLTTNTSGVSHG